MKATYFKHSCVLVKDKGTIEVLQKSGIGARVLNPIITAAESIETQEDTPLLLLDEEAFYLSQKGALEVELANDQEIATLEFLWSAFVARNENFPIKYKVFSYFKDKGYVVRTGINFGVDYCIYHTLPSLCHSEMCVTVVDATKNSATPAATHEVQKTSGSSEDLGQLNWRHVTTLTRVIPDVNKLCVICYVLPAADVSLNTTTNNISDCIGQADTSPSRVSPLDILADAVDDFCVAENAAGLTNGVDSSRIGDNVSQSSPAPPTVSPYLSTLFPTPSTSTTSTTTTTIDFSTHVCLDALSVHPVTALVRRIPALAETYQTIIMVQETYHSASTAQKKRDIKAANQKLKSNSNNNNYRNTKGNYKKNNHQRKEQSTSSTDGTTNNHSDHVTNSTAATNNTSESNPTIIAIDQETFLLTADPATLSGRQKRVAKYLQKTQMQQKEAALLPQSRQMKARRDHRENRSKTMSNKNQSLLDLMHGGDSKPSAVNNGINCGGNTVSCCNVSSVVNDTTEMVAMQGSGDTSVPMPTIDSVTTGTKRKFAEQTDTLHVSTFCTIATLFNPFTAVSNGSSTNQNDADINNDGLDEMDTTADTLASPTSSCISSKATYPQIDSSTSETTMGTADDANTRRKRCRTNYERKEGTATNEENSSGYMGHAAKHCIIL